MTDEKKQAEKQRQEMIAQGRDHLSAAQSVYHAATGKAQELTDLLNHQMIVRVCSEELVRTWLERLAGMLGVPVARFVRGETVVLVWADTDGDPLLDEEGEPLQLMEAFEDLTKTIISVPTSSEITQ